MVYMAGDNNLSEDMIRAITELRNRLRAIKPDPSAPPPSTDRNHVNYVIQFDGEHPYVKTRFYKVELENGQLPTPQVVDHRTDDTVEKKLERFIRRAMEESPADNYALILSGHSDAFLERTLLLDENPSGIASLKKIAEVLKKLEDSFPNEKKLDILGFDSCVMNAIEVVYEFKDIVHTCIGSEGSIPNFTWDYKEIGASLINETSASLTKERIIEVIGNSIKKFNRDYAFGGRSIDFSTIELDKQIFPKFSEDINHLYFILLIAFLRLGDLDKKTQILSLSPKLNNLFRIFLQTHWNCQTYLHDQFVDIFDFCERLDNECKAELSQFQIDIKELKLFKDVEKNLNQILKLIEYPFWLILIRFCCLTIKKSKTSLIKKGIFTGPDYQFSNGVSMFFPWSFLSMAMTLKKYIKLNLIKDYRVICITLIIYTVLTARRPSLTQNPIPSINLKFKDFDLTEHLPKEQEIKDFIIECLTKMAPALVKNKRNFGKFSDADILQLFGNSFLRTIFLINLTDEKIESFLFSNPALDAPGSKLDPPRSKGLDNFFYYFGRTNNIFPMLNIEGTFPNGSTNVIDETR